MQEVRDFLDIAYEEAEKDYEFRKNEIITKLISIRDCEISNDIMKVWINQAIKFIREGKVC